MCLPIDCSIISSIWTLEKVTHVSYHFQFWNLEMYSFLAAWQHRHAQSMCTSLCKACCSTQLVFFLLSSACVLYVGRSTCRCECPRKQQKLQPVVLWRDSVEVAAAMHESSFLG